MNKKIIIIYESIKMKPLTLYVDLKKDLKRENCVTTARNDSFFFSVQSTASDEAWINFLGC